MTLWPVFGMSSLLQYLYMKQKLDHFGNFDNVYRYLQYFVSSAVFLSAGALEYAICKKKVKKKIK